MSAAELASLWPAARAAAERATHVVRLPLRRQAWRGPAGAWLGAGLGNSLEFEDHRPYAPGDDLRHLDWTAYARTDQLVMKLHRHEASPQVDLALDASASCCQPRAKAIRLLELAAFAITSALEARAVLRVWVVGKTAEAWDVPAALAGRCHAILNTRLSGAPAFDRVPWRRDALRVLVSDLLFPLPDAAFVARLGGPRGVGLLLAPWSADEATPEWETRMELEDAEGGPRREQRIDAGLLARYRAAYARHFETWRDACRRHGVVFARIAAEPELTAALTSGALREGAVEWAG